MFEFIRYVLRNPSALTKRARKRGSTRRAMKEYRDLPESAVCAWCGRTKKLEVHHIEPVSVAPDKADDWDNMIMLCRKPPCHQMIGHNGNYATRYVLNVRELCDDQKQEVVKVGN